MATKTTRRKLDAQSVATYTDLMVFAQDNFNEQIINRRLTDKDGEVDKAMCIAVAAHIFGCAVAYITDDIENDDDRLRLIDDILIKYRRVWQQRGDA